MSAKVINSHKFIMVPRQRLGDQHGYWSDIELLRGDNNSTMRKRVWQTRPGNLFDVGPY